MAAETTRDATYNGWTNYETWNAKLWMDNDQDSYEHWNENAQEAWDATDADDDTETRTEEAVSTLREELQEYFEANVPQIAPSFYSDILGAALSEVNWHEIAEALIGDVDKETEDD